MQRTSCGAAPPSHGSAVCNWSTQCTAEARQALSTILYTPKDTGLQLCPLPCTETRAAALPASQSWQGLSSARDTAESDPTQTPRALFRAGLCCIPSDPGPAEHKSCSVMSHCLSPAEHGQVLCAALQRELTQLCCLCSCSPARRQGWGKGVPSHHLAEVCSRDDAPEEIREQFAAN